MATTAAGVPSHSEYVGLNQPEGALDQPSVPLPESRIQSYVKIALCLASLRFLYAFSKVLAVLGLCVFVGVALYQMDRSSNSSSLQQHQQQDEDAQMRLRMDRINREREESEAMVADAARMMLDINRRHLNEFLITHPYATYEEWIGKLHPENVTQQDKTTTTIDHRFYVEDSDHRMLWNEMIGEEREFVAVRSLNNNKLDVV